MIYCRNCDNGSVLAFVVTNVPDVTRQQLCKLAQRTDRRRELADDYKYMKVVVFSGSALRLS